MEKAAAEQDEPAEKPKEEGIRDRLKADQATTDRIKSVTEKHIKAQEQEDIKAHEQEDDDRIWDYLPKQGNDDIPSYLKTDDKENEGEEH